MKIGIFSDTHLGFDKKGQRNNESFENLDQAINLCLEENVDFCVLTGDIFDEPVPSHTSLFKSIKSFRIAQKNPNKTKLKIEKNGEIKELKCESLPILTIHGNHEFRGKEFKTALDVLNLAGLLVYFHAAKITVEKDNEKVCVFGLGAVPEKKALEVLQYWAPKTESDACNLMLLHQGFKDFMAIDDEMIATLSLADLPQGFDLIINGHLHWYNEQKLGETTFLLPGSTISTSIKKLEAEKPKGVCFFDTKSKTINFKPFPRQRKMFYHKTKFIEADIEQVLNETKNYIEKDLEENHEMKPLIRVNMKGSLKKGLSPGDVDLSDLIETYSEKAILSISKNFSSNSFKKKISDLREEQKEKLSLVSMGFELLEKNLKETDFGEEISTKKLFDLLSEDEMDEALKLVSKR